MNELYKACLVTHRRLALPSLGCSTICLSWFMSIVAVFCAGHWTLQNFFGAN